ncbi:PiggyBac transposable element-derived protein 4 [Penaeus vannamei]|uniref:PiggyBac transposable element-derived protein 4 n=1 Tax=Penaeus vannamei TaxID=6689 RepID=A0A3R7PF20_PENVA|nr:PiggyBac transposable element-derived protein 4 [Penaeus vannamei]
MPRERFEQITRNLHFVSSEAAHLEDDQLWKLRPVIDMFGDVFREVFVPEQNISIDKSLWKFRGRLFFKTYNPSKRARFGLKVYKLSASEGPCAGYTSVFRIYAGKDKGSIPSSQWAVMDLMERGGYIWKGYNMYCDNWYTSPTLFHFLQSRKMGAVGTVRSNWRFMPKDFKVSRKGEVAFRSSATGMLALAWMDSKQVFMLSTIHTSQMATVARRWGPDASKPQCVVDYNAGMKGDLGTSSPAHTLLRKSLKWYKKSFFTCMTLPLSIDMRFLSI